MSMKSTAESIEEISDNKKQFAISKNVYLLSLIVIFSLATLYFVNSKLVVNNIQKTTALENKWYVLTNPNGYPNGSDNMQNLLSTESTQFYAKRFGDRVVPWTTASRKYTAVNTKTSTSRTTQEYSVEEQQVIYFNNETGQREIQFYHPEVQHQRLPNALGSLDNLDENTYYEMALSFTQSYAFAEARFLLDQADTEWLWVDSISDAVIAATQEKEDVGRYTSFTANNIFGFPFTKNTGWSFPDGFLSVLEQEEIQDSEYAEQANAILNELKANDENLSGGKVRIIGAVVTGTPDELRKYQNLDFIRASSLGASTSIY